MFKGCGTALVTPFRQDLTFDERAMRALVRRQIDSGIDFLVPCGTTGESPTLTHDEHIRVVEVTVEEAAGRVPVLAGAGGYDTAKVVSMIAELEKLGVAGILSVTPYYNKPTQEGLFQHFKAIANSTPLPIILYSVQPRTNVNIDVATVVRLAAIPNIIGIKEASGGVSKSPAFSLASPRPSSCSRATTPSRFPSWLSAAMASSPSLPTRFPPNLSSSPTPHSAANIKKRASCSANTKR